MKSVDQCGALLFGDDDEEQVAQQASVEWGSSSGSYRLVDATVIAEITGLPISTIWRGCRENKIPHYAYGNRYRFDPREVLASLKKKQSDG